MSSPTVDEENPPPIQQTPAQAAAAQAELAALEEDSSQLGIALLAVFAAYAAYRTARGKIIGPPAVWRKVLRLDQLIGGAMLGVADRALARQRKRDPKHGKKLLPYADTSARVSVDSQMRELVTALQFYQRKDAGPVEKPKPDQIKLEVEKPKPGPKPKDKEVELPSATNPPDALAENLAVIGRNTAQLEAEIELAREESEGSTWKTWHSVADSHVRPSHQYLGSAKYEHHSVPITQPFTSIYGDQMNFPGDPTLGAPLGELINCFVAETEVSAPDVVGVMRAPYSGELVTIRTRTGRVLTGTPNHPMLTERGWVGLGQLQQGDNLVCESRSDTRFAGIDPDVENKPSTLGEIFRALDLPDRRVRMNRVVVDFHGDLPAGDVDVVSPDRVLLVGRNSSVGEQFHDLVLQRARPPVDLSADGDGSLRERLVRSDLPSPRFVGGSSEILSRIGSHSLHPESIRFGDGSRLDTSLDEAAADHVAGDTETVRNAVLGLTTEVALDDVVDIEREVVAARHVFTLSTVSGLYLAGGIVNHNCRCFMTFDKHKKLDPNEPMYLPAYWIKQPKGVQHDEMARRKAEDEAREKLLAEKEVIYTQKFGPKPAAVKASVEPITAARSYAEWMHPRGLDGKWIDKGALVNISMPDGSQRRGTITELTPNGPKVRFKDNGETSDIPLRDVKDRVSKAPPAAATLTNKQLIDNAEQVFGKDSKEHKEAIQKFANQPEQAEQLPDSEPLPDTAQEIVDNLKITSIPSDFKLVLDNDSGLVYGRDRNNQMWEITPEGKYKTSLSGQQYNEAALTDVTARWKPPASPAAPTAPNGPDVDQLSRIMRGEQVTTAPRVPRPTPAPTPATPAPNPSPELESPEAKEVLRIHDEFGAASPEYRKAMKDYQTAKRGLQYTDALNMTDKQKLDNVGLMYGTSSDRYARAKADFEAKQKAAPSSQTSNRPDPSTQFDMNLLSRIMNGEATPHPDGPPRQNEIIPNGTVVTPVSNRTIERMPSIEPGERVVIDQSNDRVFVQEEQGALFEVDQDGKISDIAVEPPSGDLPMPPDTPPNDGGEVVRREPPDRNAPAAPSEPTPAEPDQAEPDTRSYRRRLIDQGREARQARRVERQAGRRERRQTRIDNAETIDWKALGEILFQIAKDLGGVLSDGAITADINVHYKDWLHPRGKDGKFIKTGGLIDVDAPKEGWFDGDPQRTRRAKILELTPKGPSVQYEDEAFPDLIDLPDVKNRVSTAAVAKAKIPKTESPAVPLDAVVERDKMPYELHGMTADQVTKDTPGADADLVNFYWPYNQRKKIIDSWKEEYPESYAAMEEVLPTTAQFVDPATTDLMIAIPTARIAAILKQKRFKSAFETTSGIGKGVKGYKKTRQGYEDTVAGIPMDLDKKLRPIYGFVEGYPPGIGTSQYGLIKAVLHERVRGRTTVSFGDTLNLPGTKPIMIDNVGSASTDELLAAGHNMRVANVAQSLNIYTTPELTKEALGDMKPSDYVEAQFHGGVSLKDVTKFVVKRDYIEKSVANASPGMKAEYDKELAELDVAIAAIKAAGHEVEVINFDPDSVVAKNGVKPKVGQFIRNADTGQVVKVTNVSGGKDRLVTMDNKGQVKTTYTDFVELFDEDPGFDTSFPSIETSDGTRARIGDKISYKGTTYGGVDGDFPGTITDITDHKVDIDWDMGTPQDYSYIDFKKFKEKGTFKKVRETFKDKNNQSFHIGDAVTNKAGQKGIVKGYNAVQNTFGITWIPGWKVDDVPFEDFTSAEVT